MAGTETTALSLCWAMYYLSKNPEAVLRCRAEALEAAPLRCVSVRVCFKQTLVVDGIGALSTMLAFSAPPPAISRLSFDAGCGLERVHGFRFFTVLPLRWFSYEVGFLTEVVSR